MMNCRRVLDAENYYEALTCDARVISMKDTDMVSMMKHRII